MRTLTLCLAILLYVSSAYAAPIYDYNNGDGTTWAGWSWYSSSDTNPQSYPGADSFGSEGWQKDDGWYTPREWMPRSHEKNDYSTDISGRIVTDDRAPSTATGGALNVYDNLGVAKYASAWWWIHDTTFGTQGVADSTTNRMSFYLKTTDNNNPGHTTDPSNATLHVGTYLCWPGGGLGGEGCPTEAAGQHYYHYLTTSNGAWLHVLLDRHPTHQRGQEGADEPDDNPSTHEYYEYMNGFYIEYPYPNGAVLSGSYLIDEIELYTEAQSENDISISSVWVGYWSGTDKWEIGFNDNSFNSVGYGDNSQSTFEVRYSTSPITNANYASATITEPEYWERGTTNTFRRANPYKKHAWTRFTIPDGVESANDTIYFAIKDVSLTSNGDGHNTQSSLVKTVDYALRTSGGADTTDPIVTPTDITNRPSGTTSVIPSTTATDNVAVTGCRWATTDIGYSSMINGMTNSGSLYTATGTLSVSDGNSYTIYYACIDAASNEGRGNDSFSVATEPSPITNGHSSYSAVSNVKYSATREMKVVEQ